MQARTLVVRSRGSCFNQMFSTPLSVFVCTYIYYSCFHFYTTWTHTECIFVCVWICIPLLKRLHVLWHSDPLCDFCHFKHPLLQRSVTEHLPYSNLLMSDPPERGEMRSRRRRKISWVFIFSFRGATCAVLRDVKRSPSAEVCTWLWLALQSQCRQKK